jgi:thiol:disulfide interchange protein
MMVFTIVVNAQVLTLDDHTLDQAIQDNEFLMVQFYADWE